MCQDFTQVSVIKKGERFRSRVNRNRRLGEFLKELDLTEGKCTGIPTIQDELTKNGSPRAVFDTDEDRRALCVTIPIHPDFITLADKKLDIEDKKLDIDAKKSDIQSKNPDIEMLKNQYIVLLRENGNSQPIVDKMLLAYNAFQNN